MENNTGERPDWGASARHQKGLKDKLDRMKELGRLDSPRYVATNLNGAVLADPVNRARPELGRRIRFFK